MAPYTQRERAREQRVERQVDKGHVRFEIRTLTSTTALNMHPNWPGLKQVLRVENVTSLSRGDVGTRKLLEIVRGHKSESTSGAIENGLHWMRDVVFREDNCTISTGNAPQNLAALRNAALTCARDDGNVGVASRLRSFARKVERVFAMLGIL